MAPPAASPTREKDFRQQQKTERLPKLYLGAMKQRRYQPVPEQHSDRAHYQDEDNAHRNSFQNPFTSSHKHDIS